MKTLTQKGRMMVAAHRGDSYNCYENTMRAYERAVQDGAHMVETDVHLTRDGILVLMHDDAVDRTTNGSGFIRDMTYAEISSLNAGGISDPAPVPTLEMLLQFLSRHPVLLNLEIKEYCVPGNEERCISCIEKCVSLVEQYGFADKMVFNSFDAFVLEYLDEHYPGRYLLHGFYPYSLMRNVRRNPDEYLYCACVFSMKREEYAYLESRGIEPWIGAGVTIESKLRDCHAMGARLVTTNFPADCIQKLGKICAKP